MLHKILLVCRSDGEIETLAETLKKNYEVATANTTEEAFYLLKQEDIHMIFYDFSIIMKEGTSILLRVKESYPNVIRILLGEEENSVIFELIQKNICKTCILKPWDEKILTLSNSIFQTMEQVGELDFFNKLVDFKELPSPNASYQKILKLIDEEAEMSVIAKAIESDPAMAVKLLRVANSSYYGIRTTSIKQAVTYLGMNNVRDLVVSTSIFDMFNDTAVPERIFQPLWQQSFMCSKIVKEIFKSLGKRSPSYATLAGLLSNIGSIFLLNEFQLKYTNIIQTIKQLSNEDSNITLEGLEKEEFNLTHSAVGGYLLNWWELPYPIVEVALYHHDPLNENIIDKELLCIVHIAEQYSSRLVYMDNNINYLDQCFEYLSLEKSQIEKIMDEY